MPRENLFGWEARGDGRRTEGDNGRCPLMRREAQGDDRPEGRGTEGPCHRVGPGWNCPRQRDAIRAVLGAGLPVVLATGRCDIDTQPFVDALGVELHCVCWNGSAGVRMFFVGGGDAEAECQC